MFETISSDVDARGVATLTLDRADKHNAMSAQMLAELTQAAADLAAGDGWSRLTLAGQAINENLRVLLIVYPAEDGPRDGALKFDDVSLRLLEPPAQDEPS